MARLTPRDDIEGPPVAPPAPATRPDWRGWIGLAWVVFWGSAYTLTAIQARAPQILRWLRHLAGNTTSL
jgi:hypothetical protein